MTLPPAVVQLSLHAEHHALEVRVGGVCAAVGVGLFPAWISPADGRRGAGTLLGCGGMEVLRWHKNQEMGKD